MKSLAPDPGYTSKDIARSPEQRIESQRKFIWFLMQIILTIAEVQTDRGKSVLGENYVFLLYLVVILCAEINFLRSHPKVQPDSKDAVSIKEQVFLSLMPKQLNERLQTRNKG